jgi:hypothetical protein
MSMHHINALYINFNNEKRDVSRQGQEDAGLRWKKEKDDMLETRYKYKGKERTPVD